jgi:zinc transport system substrate-binding protein
MNRSLGRRLSGLSLGALLLAGTAVPASAASPSPGAADERLTVAVAFYPIEEATRAIAGDRIEIVGLTPVGGSPHDLELTPAMVDDLAGADLVLYLGGGFQAAVADMVDSLPDGVEAIDLLAGQELLPVDDQLAGTDGEVDGEVLEGGFDPHVWLDPVRFGQMVGAIEAALGSADPANAAAYAEGSAAYQARLAILHDRLAASLAECASRTIVTSHRAFGYFAQRYDLEQLPIAGVSPNQEPDPRSLEAVAQAARDRVVRTIFYESVVPRAFADTVAREIGAVVDALEPVESLTQEQLDLGLSYLALMDQNRAALVRGLPCFGD